MKLAEGDLSAEVEGRIVKRDQVLVIHAIRVVYSLALAAGERPGAERVHGFHARFCPVARTLEPAVEIETELGFRDPG